MVPSRMCYRNGCASCWGGTDVTLVWAEVSTQDREAVGNPRKGTKPDTFTPDSCATGELSSRSRVAGKKISCNRKAVYQKGKNFNALSKTTFLFAFAYFQVPVDIFKKVYPLHQKHFSVIFNIAISEIILVSEDLPPALQNISNAHSSIIQTCVCI